MGNQPKYTSACARGLKAKRAMCLRVTKSSAWSKAEAFIAGISTRFPNTGMDRPVVMGALYPTRRAVGPNAFILVCMQENKPG